MFFYGTVGAARHAILTMELGQRFARLLQNQEFQAAVREYKCEREKPSMKLCMNLPEDIKLHRRKKFRLSRTDTRGRWKTVKEEKRWRLEMVLTRLHVANDIIRGKNRFSSCKLEKENGNSEETAQVPNFGYKAPVSPHCTKSSQGTAHLIMMNAGFSKLSETEGEITHECAVQKGRRSFCFHATLHVMFWTLLSLL